jgi:hypothetical protein
MSRVVIDYEGIEEMAHDPDGPVYRIMEAAAYAVENRAKELVLAPGTGREYSFEWRTAKDGHVFETKIPRPTHRASAPGEPPASDYGDLLASIGHSVDIGAAITGTVYASARYAIWLELGHGLGRGGIDGWVAERPFLRPALDAVSEVDGMIEL